MKPGKSSKPTQTLTADEFAKVIRATGRNVRLYCRKGLSGSRWNGKAKRWEIHDVAEAKSWVRRNAPRVPRRWPIKLPRTGLLNEMLAPRGPAGAAASGPGRIPGRVPGAGAGEFPGVVPGAGAVQGLGALPGGMDRAQLIQTIRGSAMLLYDLPQLAQRLGVSEVEVFEMLQADPELQAAWRNGKASAEHVVNHALMTAAVQEKKPSAIKMVKQALNHLKSTEARESVMLALQASYQRRQQKLIQGDKLKE